MRSSIAGKGQVDVVGLPSLWHVKTPIDASGCHDFDDSEDSNNLATHSDHSDIVEENP